ncbi:MAG: hypothetical protein EHM80_09550 [Nitrospiraceae bacterium]|nr:MAG: hypothetical protein EHM80_09550 [Nitrospiraceae bacterium]
MRITLDRDQWDVSDDQLVGEVLMQVSDRAYAQQRLVTSLKLGGRPITDRDLQPMLLGKLLKEVGPIDACSHNIPEIMTNAAPAITRFASTLKAEAQGFLMPLRMNGIIPSALDPWFGQLADYMELLQAAEQGRPAGSDLQALFPWVQELLDARSIQDPVRLADILEFEVLPQLASR